MVFCFSFSFRNHWTFSTWHLSLAVSIPSCGSLWCIPCKIYDAATAASSTAPCTVNHTNYTIHTHNRIDGGRCLISVIITMNESSVIITKWGCFLLYLLMESIKNLIFVLFNLFFSFLSLCSFTLPARILI